MAFRPEYEGRETPNMGRLTGKREWETLYHGWDLADVVKDLGYVRDDGQTLVPQPHLDLTTPEVVEAQRHQGHRVRQPEHHAEQHDRSRAGGLGLVLPREPEPDARPAPSSAGRAGGGCPRPAAGPWPPHHPLPNGGRP